MYISKRIQKSVNANKLTEAGVFSFSGLQDSLATSTTRWRETFLPSNFTGVVHRPRYFSYHPTARLTQLSTKISPHTLQTGSELFQSMRNMQQMIRNALQKRLNSFPIKSRLYSLKSRLSSSYPELRPSFIILTCVGLDGPSLMNEYRPRNHTHILHIQPIS